MAMHELMDGSQSDWSLSSESNDGITWFKKSFGKDTGTPYGFTLRRERKI